MTEATSDFSITEAAKKQIIINLNKRKKGLGIRINIRTTGCSGLAYVLEFVDEVDEMDAVFSVNDQYNVYITPKALSLMHGTVMDYVKHGLNEGFEFINPNEKNRCGCGESFTV